MSSVHPTQSQTLTNIRETYYEASGTASSVVRQLALARLAFVWVFSGEAHAQAIVPLRIPTDLLWVGLFIK